MRFIYVPLPPNLPRRWITLYQGRINALNAIPTIPEKIAYIRDHAGWGALKKWLAKYSFDKCWYCEAKSSRAPCDVDHFRPKLGITVSRVGHKTHPGYYWLAYDWSNFRLSCQRCNRPEKDEHGLLRGKANEFPVRAEANRCAAPNSDLNLEEPRLLDPCVESDCALLIHTLDGEVRPAATEGTWEYERARYTIDLLGLNSWNGPEAKRTTWQSLNLLITLVGSTPEVETQIKDYIDPQHEYSTYFRSAVATHRDKQWVEALL